MGSVKSHEGGMVVDRGIVEHPFYPSLVEAFNIYLHRQNGALPKTKLPAPVLQTHFTIFTQAFTTGQEIFLIDTKSKPFQQSYGKDIVIEYHHAGKGIYEWEVHSTHRGDFMSELNAKSRYEAETGVSAKGEADYRAQPLLINEVVDRGKKVQAARFAEYSTTVQKYQSFQKSAALTLKYIPSFASHAERLQVFQERLKEHQALFYLNPQDAFTMEYFQGAAQDAMNSTRVAMQEVQQLREYYKDGPRMVSDLNRERFDKALAVELLLNLDGQNEKSMQTPTTTITRVNWLNAIAAQLKKEYAKNPHILLTFVYHFINEQRENLIALFRKAQLPESISLEFVTNLLIDVVRNLPDRDYPSAIAKSEHPDWVSTMNARYNLTREDKIQLDTEAVALKKKEKADYTSVVEAIQRGVFPVQTMTQLRGADRKKVFDSVLTMDVPHYSTGVLTLMSRFNMRWDPRSKHFITKQPSKGEDKRVFTAKEYGIFVDMCLDQIKKQHNYRLMRVLRHLIFHGGLAAFLEKKGLPRTVYSLGLDVRMQAIDLKKTADNLIIERARQHGRNWKSADGATHKDKEWPDLVDSSVFDVGAAFILMNLLTETSGYSQYRYPTKITEDIVSRSGGGDTLEDRINSMTTQLLNEVLGFKDFIGSMPINLKGYARTESIKLVKQKLRDRVAILRIEFETELTGGMDEYRVMEQILKKSYPPSNI